MCRGEISHIMNKLSLSASRRPAAVGAHDLSITVQQTRTMGRLKYLRVTTRVLHADCNNGALVASTSTRGTHMTAESHTSVLINMSYHRDCKTSMWTLSSSAMYQLRAPPPLTHHQWLMFVQRWNVSGRDNPLRFFRHGLDTQIVSRFKRIREDSKRSDDDATSCVVAFTSSGTWRILCSTSPASLDTEWTIVARGAVFPLHPRR